MTIITSDALLMAIQCAAGNGWYLGDCCYLLLHTTLPLNLSNLTGWLLTDMDKWELASVRVKRKAERITSAQAVSAKNADQSTNHKSKHQSIKQRINDFHMNFKNKLFRLRVGCDWLEAPPQHNREERGC